MKLILFSTPHPFPVHLTIQHPASHLRTRLQPHSRPWRSSQEAFLCVSCRACLCYCMTGADEAHYRPSGSSAWLTLYLCIPSEIGLTRRACRSETPSSAIINTWSNAREATRAHSFPICEGRLQVNGGWLKIVCFLLRTPGVPAVLFLHRTIYMILKVLESSLGFRSPASVLVIPSSNEGSILVCRSGETHSRAIPTILGYDVDCFYGSATPRIIV